MLVSLEAMLVWNYEWPTTDQLTSMNNRTTCAAQKILFTSPLFLYRCLNVIYCNVKNLICQSKFVTIFFLRPVFHIPYLRPGGSPRTCFEIWKHPAGGLIALFSENIKAFSRLEVHKQFFKNNKTLKTVKKWH